jgi:hypothetical protein
MGLLWAEPLGKVEICESLRHTPSVETKTPLIDLRPSLVRVVEPALSGDLARSSGDPAYLLLGHPLMHRKYVGRGPICSTAGKDTAYHHEAQRERGAKHGPETNRCPLGAC